MSGDPIRGAGRAAALLAALRAVFRYRRRGEPSAGSPSPPAEDRSGHPLPPPGDLDPARRDLPSSRRAEGMVAALLFAAAICGFGFTAIYAADGGNTQLLGIALGAALALLAAAAIIAGKAVVPQEIHVEPRGLLLDDAETDQVVGMIEQGGEGVSRRGLLIGSGILAGAGIATAAATPLASLGPTLNGIHATDWKAGTRLLDEDGKPYLADEIAVGSFYTALPEGGDPERFSAGLLVVKLPPEFLHLPAARREWAPEGIVAYSKICPHAGCAISLYRYPTYRATSQAPAFTCPCHYSTFLPGEGGRLAFGPAGRALPQLPLMIDAAGHLRAGGPFHEDIGPSWWNVHRSQS